MEKKVPVLFAPKLTMLNPPVGAPLLNVTEIRPVFVNESVEVFLLNVKPVVVLVSQVYPRLSSPTRVHVPDPIVTVRVLVLLEAKLPAVTFWLLAVNMPCVTVRTLVGVETSTRKASASVTVAPVAPLIVRAPNLWPAEVMVRVFVPVGLADHTRAELKP